MTIGINTAENKNYCVELVLERSDYIEHYEVTFLEKRDDCDWWREVKNSYMELVMMD